MQHHGDDGCSINLELQEDHVTKYGDIGSRQIIYKRLLWYEFKNTASSSGDLRDYEELSDVTLVCEEKLHPTLFSRMALLLQRGLAAMLANRVPNFPDTEIDGIL